MIDWQLRPVNFRFQLGDWVLFSASLPMQVRADSLLHASVPSEYPLPPAASTLAGSEGYAIRNLPIAREQPPLTRRGNYLCYIPLQYLHCYIDLGWTFDQYVAKFSSRTKSTIQRKIRKYREHCGGSIDWKSYSHPEDIPEFFCHASQVSKLTYQERLLDVGLPDTEDFRNAAATLAREGRVRAYVLFDGHRPVSYLYCPEHNGILVYAYLGYDPDYQSMSVGTILQWLAIEEIFKEGKFSYFDFTEGQSSHKQLFASHQRLCANIFFVKIRAANSILIYSHFLTDRFSRWLGTTLDRFGLKAIVKKHLRRA